MSTTAAQVIASVRRILLDPDADWFTDADLIDFINTAQRKAVMARPELTPSVATLTLVEGTVQQLDASAVALLDVYHNVASKRAAVMASRSMLDSGQPLWPNGTQQTDVLHWAHDPRFKTMYRVYPPNDGDGELVALISSIPTLLTSTSDNLTLSDLYKPVVDALTLAECYSANSVKRDVEKAGYYENKAMTMLGVNAQSGVALAPKVGAPGGA